MTSRLPLMDPRFNLRECAKQLLLLEDHLCHPGKRCADCICKHLMTAEALADEGAALDNACGKVGAQCEALAAYLRGVQQRYATGAVSPCDLAQELRAVRKPLVAQTFAWWHNSS